MHVVIVSQPWGVGQVIKYSGVKVIDAIQFGKTNTYIKVYKISPPGLAACTYEAVAMDAVAMECSLH